ncbi:hypothetical protein [Nocardioides daphniae]|uniref:Indole-3-glycerol phosphate synthase n=1 Tax=Nocardioides daphniae TaxID=402297 RepID=A0ABQ1PX32_9ACTN|nr:hypothetical protein [Nocardioides daphniae]GGD05459.1 hypothetical protein GCM10007231_00300 [Nocardioides daphniae]
MTEQTSSNEPIDDGIGTYDVVVLAEHEVSPADAAQIFGLHDQIADEVVYHVLIPLEDASARIEAALGSLGAGEMLAAPAVVNDLDLEKLREESEEAAEGELTRSLAALRTAGATARGVVFDSEPVGALASTTKQVDAREAIVLTSPHLVSEFFHVDWTSRARRKLGVPVLHLIEHEVRHLTTDL